MTSQPSAQCSSPSDADIRAILVQRVDVYKQAVGIVAGVIDPDRRRVVSYGAAQRRDGGPLDGDTVFEIGSVAKVFTALVLADMALAGDVRLDDPVAAYLPEFVAVPQRGGKSITLQDLATHVSGLPRLPTNMEPGDPANPYADYTVEDLYAFLSTYELTRDIGAHYEYSNVGGGLLGHALARRAGTDYESLVRTRICEPLGMHDTGITLSPHMQARMATGHDEDLAPVAYWDLPVLAGAGALRSTAKDLLEFLAAAIGLADSRLAPAFAMMPNVRRETGITGLNAALGWHTLGPQPRELLMHDGGTGGFRSFLAYHAATRSGAVVLSNTATKTGVADIGMHLLKPAIPVWQPPPTRNEVTLAPAQMDRVVGRYGIGPMTMTISREGDRLLAQAAGQQAFQLFATSETEFFMKGANVQLTFNAGAAPATDVLFRQNQTELTGRRID